MHYSFLLKIFSVSMQIQKACLWATQFLTMTKHEIQQQRGLECWTYQLFI